VTVADFDDTHFAAMPQTANPARPAVCRNRVGGTSQSDGRFTAPETTMNTPEPERRFDSRQRTKAWPSFGVDIVTSLAVSQRFPIAYSHLFETSALSLRSSAHGESATTNCVVLSPTDGQSPASVGDFQDEFPTRCECTGCRTP